MNHQPSSTHGAEGPMNPLERTARGHLAAGRFRKARDDFKTLCKKDRPRYLPILIEANVGLARQMMDTGFLENAAQVIEYLRDIAPAPVIADLDLRLAAVKGEPIPTSLPMLELLSQPTSSLTPEARLQCADDLVLTFAPVTARTPAETALATDIQAVQNALGELKLEGERQLGVPIRKAVITVPAFFNERQRKSEVFSTNHDNQESILVEVLQGESDIPDENLSSVQQVERESRRGLRPVRVRSLQALVHPSGRPLASRIRACGTGRSRPVPSSGTCPSFQGNAPLDLFCQGRSHGVGRPR